MAKFAVVEDNVVTNIILADDLATAESVTGKTCVQYTDENQAHVGFGYDGSTFEQPPAPDMESKPDDSETPYDWDPYTSTWKARVIVE